MTEVAHWLHTFGLEPGVTFEDVRQAHRDLAKVWHPDRFPSDPRLQLKAEEHLKEINEAFERLSSWVRDGRSLPALRDDAVGVPPVHKRDPLRDTWTVRPPLGIDDDIVNNRPARRSWLGLIIAAIALMAFVAALLVGKIL